MSSNNSLPQNSQSSSITRRQLLKGLAILPAVALPTIPTQETTPSEWVVSQAWRETWQGESVSQTNAARLSLWDHDCYPTGETEDNPHLTANHKAALHQIIEELNSSDLDSIFRLARLYALFPDTQGRVWEKQNEGWLGFDKVIELTREA